MKVAGTNLLDLLMVAASYVAAIMLYSSLPDPVPTHWNFEGAADGFTAKPWGAFLLPLVMSGIFLLLYLLPRISPRNFSISPFQRVYDILRTTILGFFAVVWIVALLAAAGIPVPLQRILTAGTGVLIVILGNYMGKMTKNFFVGIRTPWTLANDEVWYRTHRLGGKLIVLAGFFFLIFSLIGLSEVWGIVTLITAVLIPAVYSFAIYKKIEGLHHPSAESREEDR